MRLCSEVGVNLSDYLVGSGNCCISFLPYALWVQNVSLSPSLHKSKFVYVEFTSCSYGFNHRFETCYICFVTGYIRCAAKLGERVGVASLESLWEPLFTPLQFPHFYNYPHKWYNADWTWSLPGVILFSMFHANSFWRLKIVPNVSWWIHSNGWVLLSFVSFYLYLFSIKFSISHEEGPYSSGRKLCVNIISDLSLNIRVKAANRGIWYRQPFSNYFVYACVHVSLYLCIWFSG